jgi:hypothetical protein
MRDIKRNTFHFLIMELFLKNVPREIFKRENEIKEVNKVLFIDYL